MKPGGHRDFLISRGSVTRTDARTGCLVLFLLHAELELLVEQECVLDSNTSASQLFQFSTHTCSSCSGGHRDVCVADALVEPSPVDPVPAVGNLMQRLKGRAHMSHGHHIWS